MKETTLAIIRHLLTFGGGFLSANNLADGNDIAAGVSGIVAVVGLIWSILEKRNARA